MFYRFMTLCVVMNFFSLPYCSCSVSILISLVFFSRKGNYLERQISCLTLEKGHEKWRREEIIFRTP